MNPELKRILVLVGITGVLILGFKYIFPLIAPFLLGIVFACLIEPLVQKVERWFRFPRRIAVALILVFLTLLLLGTTALTIIMSYQEAQRLLPQIPLIVEKLAKLGQGCTKQITNLFPQISEGLANFSLDPESFDRIFRSILVGAMNWLPGLPRLFLAIGLGGLSAYFFSRDKILFQKQVNRFFPSEWQTVFNQVKLDVLQTLTIFIRIEVGLAFLTLMFTAVFFKLFGIPGCLVYSLLAGLLDFIPVLGPGLIYLPLVIVNLLCQQYWSAFLVTIAYFLLILIRQIIEYRLIGENLKLHPLVTLIIIYIGMKLFGFAGVLFSPVLIIVLRGCYRGLLVNTTYYKDSVLSR